MIDAPAVSADRREIAVFRSPDAGGESLIVEIHDVRGTAVTRRFELLSPSEGVRPLSQDLQHVLVARIDSLNAYLAQRAFRAMPLLYVSDWQRDLAFNEVFDSSLFRVVLQHPTGSLRIASAGKPSAAFERLQPALPLAPMPDCLQNTIPVQGWFDPSGIVVLRRIAVPRETCERADTWSIERVW